VFDSNESVSVDKGRHLFDPVPSPTGYTVPDVSSATRKLPLVDFWWKVG
jgi:hypothetical protein